jgi:uncharacterized protein DUF3105
MAQAWCVTGMRAPATIVLALVLAACGGGGGGAGNNGGVPKVLPDVVDSPAGCEAAQRLEIEGTGHIAPNESVTYKSNPPTSGRHYSAAGIGPVPPGVYTEAPLDGGLVHNLEHGHIIIWHAADVPKSQLDALAEVVEQDPRFRLLVPRAGMPFKVAFTAWGVTQGCTTPTGEIAKAAEGFAKRFQQKAPENIPGRPLV